MKAYVIKNKEGKYYCGFSFIISSDRFENDIKDANIFEEDELKMLECPKDCTIVPITIYEGDLEEENRVLKKALEDVCDGYVEPNVYGTDIWEEAEKCGGLEQYFIQQAKESKDERD